ncbi:MAG: hypothetical protein IH577_04615 [Deltaproteobacteria bacterium]|nr:hypothetical protein [Deltaproteobacteria bacterium]
MRELIARFFKEAAEKAGCFFLGHDPTVNDVNGYRLCRRCGALMKDGEK